MKLLLTKHCSNCGLEKPLASFLMIIGSKNTYGDICSACRKTQKKGNKSPATAEEETGTGSGLRLDDKTKVKREIDEKEHKEHVKEIDFEEREKLTEQQEKQKEKRESIAKGEREHRETFLDKRSILTTHKIDPQQAAEARQKMEQLAQQSQEQEKINKTEQALQEEQQIKGINTAAPDQSTYFGILEKHKGATFKAFVSWLTSSPMKETHQKSLEKGTLSDIINEWRRPGPKK